MHDIGKATDAWQEEEYERILSRSDKSIITHALPSAFIACATMDVSQSQINSPLHAMILAILGHHGQLHAGSASTGNARSVKLLDKGWEELSDLTRRSTSLPFQPFPTDKSFQISKMEKVFANWKLGLPNRPEEAFRFKGLYCLMSSLLRTCDGEASRFADGKASTNCPGGNFLSNRADMRLLHDWRAIPAIDVLNGKIPTRLQQRQDEFSGLCDLLTAGCGEGKTAFALRHAQALMEKGKINRIIFTLPTKFTSNNMHRDFRHEYKLPEQLVGLFHGDSRAFLKGEQTDAEEEKNNLSIGDQQQQDRVYHRPITISTVDHLLMSFYHGYKYSDWAFGNIIQSLIVFDEMHHYETLTVSAINEALAVLRQLGVPHLIMTATIPDIRVSILNQRGPGSPQETYEPLRSDGKEESIQADATELRVKESFYFRKCNEPIVKVIRDKDNVNYQVSTTFLEDILKFKHLRQIVFVNQVEKAKAVARAIVQSLGKNSPCPVICYHAEFIGRDRAKKETLIRESFKQKSVLPSILVATQIAELSLNISGARMHSEIAPLDDIVQRGGRLHRNGIIPYLTTRSSKEESFPCEMIVHTLDLESASDLLPYVDLKKHLVRFPPGTPHLLQRSWDTLPDGATYRFDNVREWVNAIYSVEEPLRHSPFRDAIQDDSVFGSKPQARFSEDGEEASGKVVLRAKEYETFDVVPMQFVDQLTEDSEENRKFLVKINEFKFWKAKRIDLIGNTVKSIRVFKRQTSKYEYDNLIYKVIKHKYEYEYGLDFSGETDFEEDENTYVRVERGNVI